MIWPTGSCVYNFMPLIASDQLASPEASPEAV